MSLINFIKDAGEKLFGTGKSEAATPAASTASPAKSQSMAELNQAAGQAIADHIRGMGLQVQDLQVDFDGATGTVNVSGTAADQATREKVVLTCGNVASVSAVNDQMAVATAHQTPGSKWYTVVKGDNLSKISAMFYGTPGEHQKIFEANQPMLQHPDKIYPGQVLRIPPT